MECLKSKPKMESTRLETARGFKAVPFRLNGRVSVIPNHAEYSVLQFSCLLGRTRTNVTMGALGRVFAIFRFCGSPGLFCCRRLCRSDRLNQ